MMKKFFALFAVSATTFATTVTAQPLMTYTYADVFLCRGATSFSL